ncbi:MAG: glycosyltransferase family 9 protein [Thermoflexaceae bacterium]|nr:glycosyltransferase family 9 protein [Thermoflexaceae bacterium]
MGFKGKVEKLLRWANIWMAQFEAVRMPNLRSSKENGKVLVIKTDAIGDFIIWLDSAREFRNIYPGKQITLMCSAPCVEIAQATGYFDEIITLNIRKFEGDNSYKKEMLLKLRELSFETMIQTAYSRTVHMDMLAASIPAKEKIGLVSDETRTNLSRYITLKHNKRRLDAVYDRLIPVSSQWLMEVKRNGELIRGLGRKDFRTGMPVLNKYDARPEIIPEGDYFILFPGASTPKKMWDIKNFAAVADYVYEKTGWTAYVCGSREEQYLYGKLAEYKKPETVIRDYFGKTTLMELSEVIRHAKLVISNDTSGIHFAAAVNTPSVCILGEYNYGRFLPYDFDRKEEGGVSPMLICNADMTCKRCAVGKMTSECKACIAVTGRYLCVDKVTVEQVTGAVDEIINTYEV